MNLKRKICLVTLLLLGTGLLSVSASQGGTVRDNFDDNFINPALWAIDSWSPGPSAEEANGRLEITIPADSSADLFMGLFPKFTLIGDFDEQIDFNLLTWPAGNGTTVGLGTGNLFSIQRKSFGPDEGGPKEEYFIYCLGGIINNTATTDTSGKLRVKRTGNKMEGFYWQDDAWQLLASFSHPFFEDEMVTNFEVSAAYFSGQAVLIGFDNFQASNKYIGNCPPFLPLLLDNGRDGTEDRQDQD